MVMEGKSNCDSKTKEPAFKSDVMRIAEGVTLFFCSE